MSCVILVHWIKLVFCREIARMLADEHKKRVVIVDTSNEIGGDGDIPHSGIGRARRMQVPNVNMQHNVSVKLNIFTMFVATLDGLNKTQPFFFWILNLSFSTEQVMIEAVENHMPETIIIDEIGTELEALAASTIAQRGVQLVGTAHGITIDNIIKNPSLQILVGGIEVKISIMSFNLYILNVMNKVSYFDFLSHTFTWRVVLSIVGDTNFYN